MQMVSSSGNSLIFIRFFNYRICKGKSEQINLNLQQSDLICDQFQELLTQLVKIRDLKTLTETLSTWEVTKLLYDEDLSCDLLKFWREVRKFCLSFYWWNLISYTLMLKLKLIFLNCWYVWSVTSCVPKIPLFAF